MDKGMTREETTRIVRIIVNSYPSFRPSAQEVTDMIDTWDFMFSDYPYQVVSVALKAFITTDNSGFPPSVGQLTELIHKMAEKEEDNEAAAWQMVSRAVSNSIYNSEEEFLKLPPLVQKAVGGAHNLKEWAMQDVDTFSSVTASNFRRVYRAEEQRQKELNRLPKEAKELMERLKGEDIIKIGENKTPS